MYKLIRPLLFIKDPELMHEMTIAMGKILAHTPFMRLFAWWYGVRRPSLLTNVFGINFPNPVGLAAGFDKHGELLDVAPCIGFGFVEVGTVTPQAQAGNPKPRLFRLLKDEGIINRMGFNNGGLEEMVRHLGGRGGEGVVGVNMGKNKITPNEEAVSDYEQCFLALADYADYLVVNVSSPNTPNLRALQERTLLTALLMRLQTLNSARSRPKPILLKIAPDLTDGQLDDIIAIVRETRIIPKPSAQKANLQRINFVKRQKWCQGAQQLTTFRDKNGTETRRS